MISPLSTNLMAMRALQLNMRQQSESLIRLATGQRLNRGADDPAGLITAERLRSMLKTLEAETTALERADQVIATADGALGEMSSLLADAEGLAVAAANTGGLSQAEREAYQLELDSILASVNRIAETTSFNGAPLLDGTATVTANGESLSIDGVRTSDIGAVEIDGETYTLADTGQGGALNLVDGDLEGASAAIAAAQSDVATLRGRLGAFSKHTIGSRLDSLGVATENLAAAESAIRDTDFAFETAELSRLQVLYKASARAFGTILSASVLDLLA